MPEFLRTPKNDGDTYSQILKGKPSILVVQRADLVGEEFVCTEVRKKLPETSREDQDKAIESAKEELAQMPKAK